MEKRNSTIDLAKYVASVMIVAIHTGLFSDVNENLSFVVVHIVCRLAVPFFAVCSGYFIGGRLEFDETMLCSSHNKVVFIKQWKKLILLYGIWSVIYLLHSIPMWIEIGWFSPFAVVDYAIGAVTKGSHYHFWYLWGMIYVLPVFYFLLRIVPGKYLGLAAGLLWILKAATYGYGVFLPASLALELLQKAGTPLCLLPLLLTGALAARVERKTRYFYGIGFAISALCLTTEAFMLKNAGQDAVSYILFTLPVGYFLLQLLLGLKTQTPGNICTRLGTVSMFVYCVHPMLVETTEDILSNSIPHFLFVAIGSTLLGFLYLFAKEKMIGKKVEKCST